MSVTNVTREELWAKQHLSCKTWIMRYGNGINPCSRSCPESMAAVLSWWMYIRMLCVCFYGFVDWLGYDRHKIETLENRVIIWSHVFIRMIAPNWKTCKSGWGSSFITSLLNIGMTIVMCIVSVYSMLVATMCV